MCAQVERVILKGLRVHETCTCENRQQAKRVIFLKRLRWRTWGDSIRFDSCLVGRQERVVALARQRWPFEAEAVHGGPGHGGPGHGVRRRRLGSLHARLK